MPNTPPTSPDASSPTLGSKPSRTPPSPENETPAQTARKPRGRVRRSRAATRASVDGPAEASESKNPAQGRLTPTGREPRVAWTKGIAPGVSTAVAVLAVVEIVVFLAVMAGGFADLSLGSGLALGAQLWLLSLGVPLDVAVSPLQGAEAVSGTVSMLPMGLGLLTAGVAFGMGHRLARRAPEGAGLAAAVFTTAVTHAVIATVVAVVTASGVVRASPWAALAFGGLIVLVATAAGALVGGGTPAALVGKRAVQRARKAGQDMRWAGAYLWAVLRAATVATVAGIGVGALMVVVALAFGWQQVITIQQQLGPDAVGDTVFTVLHLTLLPNFLIWALAWSSGAGFALGEGSLVSPAGTQAEVVPLLPILGALPPQEASPVLAAAPALVVLCGLLAGWWFVREGENHLGEWIAIRIPWRPVSAPVVVIVTGVFIGAVTTLFIAILAAVASGSLGIGRMTVVGPHVWETALTVGVEVAIGAAIGTAVAPWVEQGRSVTAYGSSSAAQQRPTRGTGASSASADERHSQDAVVRPGSASASRTSWRTGTPARSGETAVASSTMRVSAVASPESGASSPRQIADGVEGSEEVPDETRDGAANTEPDGGADGESDVPAQGASLEDKASRGGIRRQPKSPKVKTSRGATERDREEQRRRSIEEKHRQRIRNADLKAQKRYDAAQKRRERRKAARDR